MSVCLIRTDLRNKSALLALQACKATPHSNIDDNEDDMYMDEPPLTPPSNRALSRHPSHLRSQGSQHQGSSRPTPQPRSPALRDKTNQLASPSLRDSREQSIDTQDDEEDGDPMVCTFHLGS